MFWDEKIFCDGLFKPMNLSYTHNKHETDEIMSLYASIHILTSLRKINDRYIFPLITSVFFFLF